MRCWTIVVTLSAVLSSATLAEDRTANAAEQLAGLFMQSCVQFAGDARGLRQWTASIKLAPLPPPGQDAFLKGHPGIAYDATNAYGKFVVISGEDGSCSVIAERADPAALLASLERFAAQAGFRLDPAGDHRDPDETALHWRDYRLTKGGRAWTVAAGTAPDPSGGLALLSITPR